MKLIYCIFLIPFFWVQADNQDFSKIENLINHNFTELVKDDNSTKVAEEKKVALEIATKIQSGECPKTIDETLKPYAIKKLSSSKIDAKKVEEVINCIDSLGIKKDKDFTLMIDLLPFWQKENPFVEQFYTKFFKGYKKPNAKTLGLLDNAIIMCSDSAIKFLEKDNYPTNVEKTLSEKEYSLFLEYVKNYRCYGYSNSS